MEVEVIELYILGLAEIIFLGTLLFKSIYSSYQDAIEDKIKIKFKSFVYFYNINPNRWELKRSYVTFKSDYKPPTDHASKLLSYAPEYVYTKFRFGLIGCVRYKLWKLRKDKNDKIFKDCEEYQRVLDVIADDIRKAKDEASRLNKEGLNILDKVLENKEINIKNIS